MRAAERMAPARTEPDPSTCAGSVSNDTTATVVMTACADSRSKITARAAAPGLSLGGVSTRACRQARDASPSTPPGRTWFRKIDTLMFNGYSKEVAHLYRGIDLRRFF